MQALPRAASETAPVPADARQAAIIALIAAANIAHAHQQCAQRRCLGGGAWQVSRRSGGGKEPRELARSPPAGRAQPRTDITEQLRLALPVDKSQYARNDLKRKRRRGLKRFQVERERRTCIAGSGGHARSQNPRAR